MVLVHRLCLPTAANGSWAAEPLPTPAHSDTSPTRSDNTASKIVGPSLAYGSPINAQAANVTHGPPDDHTSHLKPDEQLMEDAVDDWDSRCYD